MVTLLLCIEAKTVGFLPRYTRVRGTRNYIYNLILFENKINPYIQDFAVISSFRTQV